MAAQAGLKVVSEMHTGAASLLITHLRGLLLLLGEHGGRRLRLRVQLLLLLERRRHLCLLHGVRACICCCRLRVRGTRTKHHVAEREHLRGRPGSREMAEDHLIVFNKDLLVPSPPRDKTWCAA